DDTDKPVDNKQCTADVCSNGVASNPGLPVGTACNQNGVKCDGNGNCVQCNAPSDCGVDTECKQFTCTAGACGTNFTGFGVVTSCKTRTCSAGVCGFSFTPANHPVGSQTPGDCKSNQCDGAGNPVVVNDGNDRPVDGIECTSDVCTGGTPSNPPLPQGTACS